MKTFNMDENKLMHKCYPQYLHMGTSKVKGNKETEENSTNGKLNEQEIKKRYESQLYHSICLPMQLFLRLQLLEAVDELPNFVESKSFETL